LILIADGHGMVEPVLDISTPLLKHQYVSTTAGGLTYKERSLPVHLNIVKICDVED
jgi:hypothetical protein